MVIKKFDKDVLKSAKSVFKYRGSIKACSLETKIDRTTIPRVLKKTTADERIVNALSRYIREKSMNAA